MISYIILGFVVGVVSVFLGLGGGFILVPVLPWLFSVPVKETSAISLATIFVVTTFNSLFFTWDKVINWRVARYMGIACAISSFIFAFIAKQIPDFYLYISDFIIISSLAVFTLMKTIKMSKGDLESKTLANKSQVIKGGLFAGAIAGVSGLGAGTIISPIMIRAKVVSNKEITPTANAVMMFTTFAASFPSFLQKLEWPKWGYIDLKIVLTVSSLAIFFSFILKKYQSFFSVKTKSIFITLILFSVSLRILLNLLKSQSI